MKRLIDFNLIIYYNSKLCLSSILKKLISYVLFALILQSCVVYRSTPIALEDAYNKGMVKIVTSDGSKLKYDNLMQKDEITFGATEYLKDNTNFWREYIRDEEGNKVLDYIEISAEIKSVHLKNKFVTTTLYILPPLAAGVGIFLVVIMATGMGSFSY